MGYASVSKDATEKEEESDEPAGGAPIFHSAQDWLVVVGEKDVVPALELAIRFMNVGETALVWSHSKFAYGLSPRSNGDYTLPPNSHVKYRVTVKSIIDDKERDEPGFLIRYSAAKKGIGNDVFANEWDLHQGKAKAIQLYTKGASNLQLLLQRSSEIEDRDLIQQASSLMIDCLNNIVAVHLRAKEYHAAKEAAVKVLTVEPGNAKSLLRAAKAALLDPASSYEEVRAALDAAAETEGADDKELAKLRTQFQQQQKEYRKRSKAFASKMISKDDTSSSSRSQEPSQKHSTDESMLTGPGRKVSTAESVFAAGENSTFDRESTSHLAQKEELSSGERQNGTPQQAGNDEMPIREDWDWKTLVYFLLKQLLIVGAVLAYTKWGHPQGSQGRATTEL